jgi:outer membrane protein assembly factor BamB
MFSAKPEELSITFDPQGGFTLVGPCMHRGGEAWLRAVDLGNRRVGWESASIGPMPTRREMALRARAIYVARGEDLLAADLSTGRERWRVPLGARPESVARRGPGGGCQVIDACEEAPNVVVVVLEGGSLVGLDGSTGAVRWRKDYGRKDHAPHLAVHPVERSGTVVAELTGQVEVLRARDGKVLFAAGVDDGARVDRVSVEGRCLVALVRDYGAGRAQGILLVDAPTGDRMGFDEAPGVVPRVRPAVGGGRVYVVTADASGRERIVHVPGGGMRELHRSVAGLAMAGPTLVALLRTGERSAAGDVVGLDPRDLSPRFEHRELVVLEGSLETNGRVFVLATQREGRKVCDLRAFDASTGEPLWTRSSGEWLTSQFLGGHLVATRRGRVEILDAENGRAVLAYPF